MGVTDITSSRMVYRIRSFIGGGLERRFQLSELFDHVTHSLPNLCRLCGETVGYAINAARQLLPGSVHTIC